MIFYKKEKAQDCESLGLFAFLSRSSSVAENENVEIDLRSFVLGYARTPPCSTILQMPSSQYSSALLHDVF